MDQLIHNWLEIWTAGPTALFTVWLTYAIGIGFMICAPGYAVSIGPMIFGIKHEILSAILKWTVIVHAVLAIAPCALPFVIPYGGWRLYREYQQHRQDRGRSRGHRRGRGQRRRNRGRRRR